MIEEQPRGLSENELRLKVNEIITKFNVQELRLAKLEAKIIPDDNTKVIEALKQADNEIQKAISFFKRTAKENQR